MWKLAHAWRIIIGVAYTNAEKPTALHHATAIVRIHKQLYQAAQVGIMLVAQSANNTVIDRECAEFYHLDVRAQPFALRNAAGFMDRVHGTK